MTAILTLTLTLIRRLQPRIKVVYAELVEAGMERSQAVREAIKRVKGRMPGSLLAAAAEEPVGEPEEDL